MVSFSAMIHEVVEWLMFHQLLLTPASRNTSILPDLPAKMQVVRWSNSKNELDHLSKLDHLSPKVGPPEHGELDHLTI